MKWPERPTCHSIDPVFTFAPIEWRPADETKPIGGLRPFRTCSYCGSIHPEDLINYFRGGAKLEGSDWKYGYPHKFYVSGIPHPMRGQKIAIGTDSKMIDGVRVETPVLGTADTCFGKWYSDHLMDEGYDDEALELIMNALTIHTGIKFFLKNGSVAYSAPYHGFQK